MEQKTVQILQKKIRIAIKDGDETIGEIAFNPDDTRTYKRFLSIIEMAMNGNKEINKIESGIDKSALDKKFETVEDFENASDVFSKMLTVTNIADESWNELCKGLDEIFGAGVCEAFTGGDMDTELLNPLVDCVMPYFREARQEKAKPYLRS